MREARPWREAWEAAVYGPGGFWTRSAPAAHFRTSVHVSDLYAGAIAELLGRVDTALGHPDRLDLVDVGAGGGELLAGVEAHLDSGVRRRLRTIAVEVGPLPALRDVRLLPPVTGLLVANEWLDDVPLDVVEVAEDGPRLVLVDADGTESLGPPPDPADRTWLDRWWALGAPDPTRLGGSGGPGGLGGVGERGEVGRSRDRAWAAAVGRIARGVALAVDYGHEATGRPRHGTLTGYRDGLQVPPVPDGSCNLTAHVALDSAAAAGRTAGAGDTRLDDQRTALLALGVDPRRPPVNLARTDPAAYVEALRTAAEAGELTDRAGLGAFGWLVQGVGIKVPFPPIASRARVRRAPAPPPP
ncbi:MAG TPA: SAM-dependent methyltransferase [Mycobacteriales bacterium]|nr:SAM-dependent methyltransferase [Mycobacteriales bacterium]